MPCCRRTAPAGRLLPRCVAPQGHSHFDAPVDAWMSNEYRSHCRKELLPFSNNAFILRGMWITTADLVRGTAMRTYNAMPAVQVRIAAAYALANGAADAKRQRDAKRAAQEAAAEQASQHDAPAQNGDPNDLTGAAHGESEPGSPPMTARVLETQPNTPHPYRINAEFYRTGSDAAAAAAAGPGSVRFSDAEAAKEHAIDNDMAVPLPGEHTPERISKREGGRQSQAEVGEDDDEEPIEKRSGSWLGWLGWSRAPESPKADALNGAERGEAAQKPAAVLDAAAQELVNSDAGALMLEPAT